MVMHNLEPAGCGFGSETSLSYYYHSCCEWNSLGCDSRTSDYETISTVTACFSTSRDRYQQFLFHTSFASRLIFDTLPKEEPLRFDPLAAVLRIDMADYEHVILSHHNH